MAKWAAIEGAVMMACAGPVLAEPADVAAAVAFLGFSLRKQLKRVNFEEEPDAKDAAGTTESDERTSNGTA